MRIRFRPLLARTVTGFAGVAAVATVAALAGCSADSVQGVPTTGAPTQLSTAGSVHGPSDPPSASAQPSGPSTPIPTAPAAGLDTAAPQGQPGTAGAGAPAGEAVSCPSATKQVNDTNSLKSALTSARPGDVIELADGTYSDKFETTRSGTADRPIWLCGSTQAVLDGGGIKEGYAFYLNKAKYWRLVGFSVTNGQKGVVVDGGTHEVIQGLTVSHIGDEGIHLRSATTYSVVRANTVSDTGLRKKKFGEGVYVGSATSNWCKYSGCGPDRSDYDSVVGNRISRTTGEAVDIKEGTRNGRIVGNTFDGAGGLTGADSWVDVKGSDWLIEANRGTTSPQDGFQVHEVVNGWGVGNVFRGNVAVVNGPGYGFHITPVADNVVACDNKATGAAQGLSNTTCK